MIGFNSNNQVAIGRRLTEWSSHDDDDSDDHDDGDDNDDHDDGDDNDDFDGKGDNDDFDGKGVNDNSDDKDSDSNEDNCFRCLFSFFNFWMIFLLRGSLFL